MEDKAPTAVVAKYDPDYSIKPLTRQFGTQATPNPRWRFITSASALAHMLPRILTAKIQPMRREIARLQKSSAETGSQSSRIRGEKR